VRIGIFIGEASGDRTSVEDLLANAREAEQRGFTTGWVPHIPWSLDAMTAVTLAATVTSRLELATAVLPTFPRHPLALGQEALSVQAVAGGRFTLGIGPSHPVVIENMYGLSYDNPAARTAEYVEVLQACFARTGRVQYSGNHYQVNAMLEVPAGADVPLLIAALGPKMLELTGRLADGTVTYWADERAIGEHVVPRITASAAEAGRAAPRVVAGLPVAVVTDVEKARDRAARLFSAYETIPTYQRILSRGAASSPVDVAIVGTEAQVRERLQRFEDAGATDLCASVLGLDDDRDASRRATLDLLASV
jgi:F420-dependent oxidoreductase-like protein